MEVLQRTANRGSISTGFDINNSVKLEDDNTEYLQRPASGSDGSRRTMTISMWLKRTEIDDDQIFISQGSNIRFRFKPNYFDIRLTNGSSTYEIEDENRFFRDTSAWYHLVVAIDTTQSTASNRVKIYWNGVQQTSFTAANYPSQNDDLTLGNFSATTMQLGYFVEGGYGFNGYFAEVHYVDGTQVAQTEFGEFDDDSGIWKPKEYTGGHGSEGFHLKFEDSSNLGLDSSGNSNNFNLTNITAADQSTDTPTNNFCTLNPLWTWTQTMGVSDGATKVNNTVTAWGGAKGSIGVNSGKWYWEHGSFSGNDTMFGIQNQAGGGNAQAYLDAYTLAIQANANVIQFTDPSNRTEAFSKTFSISDIWGVALDLDNNTIAFYRNGSIVNSAFSIDGLIGNGEFFPFVTHYGSGLNSIVNFGGYTGITISSAASDENGYGTFEYAPPTGYYALCTKNLAEFG